MSFGHSISINTKSLNFTTLPNLKLKFLISEGLCGSLEQKFQVSIGD